MPPAVPPTPPPGKERFKVIKEIAKWAAKEIPKRAVPIATLLEGAVWLNEARHYVDAYLDDPKSLDDLRNAVSDPQPGYDIHHIVEQTPAEKEGYSREQIDGPENKVRIPTLKHWQINSWYGTKSKEFGGKSPREFLRGRDWNERTMFGHRALIEHGVLKP